MPKLVTNVLLTVFLALPCSLAKAQGKTLVQPARTARDNEIGLRHNEALRFVQKHPDFLKIRTGKKTKGFTTRDVSQIQNVLRQFMSGKGFSVQETSNVSNHFSKFLADVASSRGGNAFDVGRIDNRSKAMPVLAAQKGYVSLTVGKEIVKVQEMATNKQELKVILEYVEKQVRPRLRLKDDIRRMDVFVSVCNESRRFWTSQPQQLKAGTGTIIADGAGAAYGLLLGPIGSIFYGTLFSVIANES